MSAQTTAPRAFAFHPREWGGDNAVVPVVLRGTDITGRVLIEYPGGRRDWVSGRSLYTDQTGDRIYDYRAAIAKAER